MRTERRRRQSGARRNRPRASPQDSSLFLTPKEAARELRCGIGPVRRLVRRGVLPAVSLGPRLLRIPRVAVEALAARAVPAA